jgi:RHS repeat-associated protein
VYGNVASVNSIAIIYDALGRQAEQQSGSNYKQFIYSPTGQKLAWASGQTLGSAWVQLPGGAGVVYTPGGIALYRHPDWLGSVRATSTGASPTSAYSDVAYAPFGEPYSVSGASYAAFTGQNQDTILGLTDFPFREYSPTQGRWISPDPAGLAAVDPTNPQTWNRYAYVMNNPLSFIDPLGLNPEFICITWTVSTDNDTSAAPGASGQDCSWQDDGTSNLPNVITPSCPAGENCQSGPASNETCVVAVSCTPTQNPLTKGNVHCGITTGANGTYTRYDGGPNGSGGDSGHAALSILKVNVTGGTFPPPGNIIFNSAVSCGVVSCIGQAAYQINTANTPYTLLPMAIGLTPATSNSAAQAMTSSCTLNVPYPSNAPGATQ